MLDDLFADLDDISDRELKEAFRMSRKEFPNGSIKVYCTSHMHYNIWILNISISFDDAVDFIKTLPGIDNNYVELVEAFRMFTIRDGRRKTKVKDKIIIREHPRLIRADMRRHVSGF